MLQPNTVVSKIKTPRILSLPRYIPKSYCSHCFMLILLMRYSNLSNTTNTPFRLIPTWKCRHILHKARLSAEGSVPRVKHIQGVFTCLLCRGSLCDTAPGFPNIKKLFMSNQVGYFLSYSKDRVLTCQVHHTCLLPGRPEDGFAPSSPYRTPFLAPCCTLQSLWITLPGSLRDMEPVCTTAVKCTINTNRL